MGLIASSEGSEVWLNYRSSPYTCCKDGQSCLNNGWHLFIDESSIARSLPDKYEVEKDTRRITFTDPKTSDPRNCRLWDLFGLNAFVSFFW